MMTLTLTIAFGVYLRGELFACRAPVLGFNLQCNGGGGRGEQTRKGGREGGIGVGADNLVWW